MDLAFNAVAWRLGKKSDQQKKVATKDAGILNCCTLFSYAFWRVGSAFGDGTIGAVTLLYTEDFGMSMSTIAMCICTHMREHGTQLNTHGTRHARARGPLLAEGRC